MARRPRVFAPQVLYHVIVRGNHRQATFRTPVDYQAYLERLGRYLRQCQVRLSNIGSGMRIDLLRNCSPFGNVLKRYAAMVCG